MNARLDSQDSFVPVHCNVARALAHQARVAPQGLALAVANGRGGFVEQSFAQLEAEASRCAHALRQVGIDRGVRSVVMVPPSPEFFALTFALFKIGALPVFVDPGMGLANLKTCLAHARAEAFVGVRKAQLARVILGWCKETLKIAITVGEGVRCWGGPRLHHLCHDAPATPVEPLSFSADEPAALLFTSGSTGVPKGALYTHGMFEAQVAMIRQAFAIAPGERDLSTFPLFALFGPALGMASIVPHMDTSRPGRADPQALIAAIERYQCTNAFASPALVDKLGRHLQTHKITLRSLKRVISAGAPASPPSLQRLCDQLDPDARVYTPYGATEAMPLTAIEAREIADETAAKTREGAGVCVGRPLPGVGLGIAPIDDAPQPLWRPQDALGCYEIGEIIVRAPVVSPLYDGRDDQTKLAKMHDDAGQLYHRMGDVGYFDESGRLWMCGRKSQRVVTEYGTLYSIPCEAVFEQHPALRRAALVGVTIQGKTQPLLCVELESPATAPVYDELVAELVAIGERYRHTQSISHFLVHPSFPVDVRHNAKIFREKLAAWAQERVQ